MKQHDFASRLIAWHQRHGRHDLPWQKTRDPYRVWLSEIMLQQTQVAAVIPYYARFLARLPSLASLADAPSETVMSLWSGLGYYARARNLHACATAVMEKHGGEFPRNPEQIAALPGIGRSTAHAIAVFCFDAQLPILDGNVKRVLARCFGIEGFPGTAAVEKRMWKLAAELSPAADNATYIQAQMDLGATVCTRGKPRCDACPLAEICVAKREGRIEELPAPRPARALPVKQVRMLVLLQGDQVLLETRPPSGIWGGLQSLPEVPDDEEPQAFAQRLGYAPSCIEPLPDLTHGFTHFHLHITPLMMKVENLPRAREADLRALPLDQIDAAPLPTPIRKILRGLVDRLG